MLHGSGTTSGLFPSIGSTIFLYLTDIHHSPNVGEAAAFSVH
jgi:hypothetical protein